MEISPILSYNQIKKINVNTTNIKLGINPFTIQFKISKQLSTRQDGFDSDSHDQINTNENNGNFFPIFTYNKILLYDHFNLNKNYFYNAHACYIYRNKIQQLINGMSDTPKVLLSLSIPYNYGQNEVTSLNVSLIRNNNTFSMVMYKNYKPIDSYYNERTTVSTTLTNSLNLDNFDNDELTIGYAERIPTYLYDSHTYKNTLNCNLDYFKIFKNENVQTATSNNITNNSKYNFNDITYHNRDNKKCTVNQKYFEKFGEDYYIKNIYDMSFYMTDTEDPQNDDNLVDIRSNSLPFKYENLKNVYPIIKLDVERQLDANNIEFYQDNYVITGLYNDTTADFTTTYLIGQFDSTIISEMVNIISTYDIFKGYVEQTITPEVDITTSTNGQNYLIFFKLINDLILNYNSNNCKVKSFRIITDKKCEYYFSCGIRIGTIKNDDYEISKNDHNFTNQQLLGSQPYYTESSPYFKDYIYISNINQQLFYYFAYTDNVNTNYVHNHLITLNDTGMSLKCNKSGTYDYSPLLYKNFDQVTYSNYIPNNSILGKILCYASSKSQFDELFSNFKNVSINDDFGSNVPITLRKQDFDISQNTEQLLDSISKYTIETTDGTVLLIIDKMIFDKWCINDLIVKNISKNYLLTNIILIFVHLNNGDKYFLNYFNKQNIIPIIVDRLEVSNLNVPIIASEDITANLSNDLSEIVLSFENKNLLENFIILKYKCNTQIRSLQYNVSNNLHSLFHVQKDNVPITYSEKQYIQTNNIYIFKETFSIYQSLSDIPFIKNKTLKSYIQTGDINTNPVTITNTYKLNENVDNTWYVSK